MASNFERAMQAALVGPEVKKLKIFDHEFNVKPAEITRQGTTVTAVHLNKGTKSAIGC